MAPAVVPADFLAEADRLLCETVPNTRGVWPRACVWLERLALEAALDDFLERRMPEVRHVGNTRAKLLMIRDVLDKETAGDTAGLWAALSHAGHHHSYDLAPTAVELRMWHDDVARLVERLAAA